MLLDDRSLISHRSCQIHFISQTHFNPSTRSQSTTDMVMKRSATSTRSPTPDLDPSSDFAPSPPSSNLVSTPKKTASVHKKVKVEPRSDETEHKDVKPKVTTPSKKGGAAGGPWTPAKKRELAEIVISRGLASISAEELANLVSGSEASRLTGLR